MTDWWWKVGFTPRAIRHVHRNWHLSSSGVTSKGYIWVLSLEVASWAFEKKNFFQASVDHLCIKPYSNSKFLHGKKRWKPNLGREKEPLYFGTRYRKSPPPKEKYQWGSGGLQAWPETTSWWELITVLDRFTLSDQITVTAKYKT